MPAPRTVTAPAAQAARRNRHRRESSVEKIRGASVMIPSLVWLSPQRRMAIIKLTYRIATLTQIKGRRSICYVLFLSSQEAIRRASIVS
jgi:hypothetical protein